MPNYAIFHVKDEDQIPTEEVRGAIRCDDDGTVQLTGDPEFIETWGSDFAHPGWAQYVEDNDNPLVRYLGGAGGVYAGISTFQEEDGQGHYEQALSKLSYPTVTVRP